MLYAFQLLYTFLVVALVTAHIPGYTEKLCIKLVLYRRFVGACICSVLHVCMQSHTLAHVCMHSGTSTLRVAIGDYISENAYACNQLQQDIYMCYPILSALIFLGIPMRPDSFLE